LSSPATAASVYLSDGVGGFTHQEVGGCRGFATVDHFAALLIVSAWALSYLSPVAPDRGVDAGVTQPFGEGNGHVLRVSARGGPRHGFRQLGRSPAMQPPEGGSISAAAFRRCPSAIQGSPPDRPGLRYKPVWFRQCQECYGQGMDQEPRLHPAETRADPEHHLIECPEPAVRAYAVASCHGKIVLSHHKP
jgi:hypothetical protein